ncbi:helix-turn-helix domain-containing protein [Nocardia sp. NPDC059764]|uniref:helix-turn-helix domain-containing protein n=1 Tax=Nocardia sp. NPDC059764 TaxID=3346939 RepID=UPI003658A906
MAFGGFMRQLRGARSLTRAGQQIDVSPPTVMRLEDGFPSKVSTPQIRVLLDYYAAEPEQVAHALALWADIKTQEKIAKAAGASKGWWQGYSDQYARDFEKYLLLESATDDLTTHQLVVVPGLLQAPDYRRAMIKGTDPDVAPVDIELGLTLLSTRRRQKLDEERCRVSAVLSEAVLHHRPCDPEAMAAQLFQLIADGERPNVSVRIIPLAAGFHPGLTTGSFTLLRFPLLLPNKIAAPPVVYAETAGESLYTDRPDLVARFSAAVADMQAVALAEEATRDLVSKLAKEYLA